MGALAFTDHLPQAGMSQRDLLAILADRRRTRGAIALSSGARTVTTFSSTITNPDCSGIIAYLNISVAAGAGGVRFFMRGICPASGITLDWFPIGSSPLRSTTGIFVYEIHPALQASPTALHSQQTIFAAQVPRQFQLYVEPTTADSYTYSLGYDLIP